MSTIADKLAWPALLRTYRPELSEVTAAANLPCARRCAPRTRTCRSLCPLNSSSCAPPAPNPLAGRGRINQSFSERSSFRRTLNLFCGTLLPRRRLKLGYLVQEDGEQVRGGLVSGAAGLIGLHCLPKYPFSVRLWYDPVLYQGRETKPRKLKSSDSRSGCGRLRYARSERG